MNGIRQEGIRRNSLPLSERHGIQIFAGTISKKKKFLPQNNKKPTSCIQIFLKKPKQTPYRSSIGVIM